SRFAAWRSSGMAKGVGYFTPWSRPSLTVPRPRILGSRSVLPSRRLGSTGKGLLPGGGADGGAGQGQLWRRCLAGLYAPGGEQIFHGLRQVGGQGQLGGPGGDDVGGAAGPGGEGLVRAHQIALAGFGAIHRQGRP